MIAKTCKFYLSSRCLLKGKFCDLNCNQAFSDPDNEFSDKADSPTRWQTDNKELESNWSKFR